jgi:hypothetical protein
MVADMTGVDKDLDTLCAAAAHGVSEGFYEREEVAAALARVEAELSRLREQRDAATEEREEWIARAASSSERWEAAEARCARLQQALEAARREAGRAQDVRVNRTRIIGNIALIADEALAGQPADAEGPDTPADDEPCSCCDGEGCAYCTPADSQPEEPTT